MIEQEKYIKVVSGSDKEPLPSLSSGNGIVTTLNVIPSTEPQTILAPEGVDGYNPVNVGAVTASIDHNIVSSNIKNGVRILGVTGTYGNPPVVQISRVVTEGSISSVGVMDFIDLSNITEIGDYGLACAYCESSFDGHIELSNIISIKNYGCYNTFYKSTDITSVRLGVYLNINGKSSCESMFADCSNLRQVDGWVTQISGDYACVGMFQNCTSLVGLQFIKGITSISGDGICERMFDGCSSLQYVYFSNLETINGPYAFSRAFRYNASLEYINFNALKEISIHSYSCFNEAFQGCSGLTKIEFPLLAKITNYCFLSAFIYSGLQDLYFRCLYPDFVETGTTCFDYMLYGVTGCTVHFPANLSSVIGSWTSVTNGFSGTNTTVLFDLPQTVTLVGANGKSYIRSPSSDEDEIGVVLYWRELTAAGYLSPTTPSYSTEISEGATIPDVGSNIYDTWGNIVTTISSII